MTLPDVQGGQYMDDDDIKLNARVNMTMRGLENVDEPSIINDNFNLTLFSVKTAKS